MNRYTTKTFQSLLARPGRIIAAMLAAMCLCGVPAMAADYTITPSSGDYLNLANVGLQPGDHVYLQAGTYRQLTLLNITQGTSQNPIIITNSGGQVIISGGWGLRLPNCKNFILQGTAGAGYEYGIKIQNSGNDSNMGLSLNGGTTDFTITGLEIGPNIGFAGIFAKSDDPAYYRPWVMQNIKIYHNYIHDTGGEGMYVGNTEPLATPYHEVQNVEIYDNLLENNGWDGIQLARATLNPSVHDNVIINAGVTSTDNWQGQGIVLGSGFSGSCYNNWVYNGITGILCYPWKAVRIYNNVILNSREHGIYIGDDNDIVAGYPVHLMNNTIVSPKLDGIQFRSIVSSGNLSYNNIIASPKGAYFRRVYPGVTVAESNNLYTALVSNVGFVDAANGNYNLSAGSPAVNAGTNVSSYGITSDYAGTSRPQGGAYDIGAYEYASGLLGDFNGDGVVDLGDYTIWADHFGQDDRQALAPGSSNGDGAVDLGDYTTWADHFGETAN